MLSWYYFRLPDGAKVAYKGQHVGEALTELLQRTGYEASDVQAIGSELIRPPVRRPDYERIKRGVALGRAALDGVKSN